MTVGPHASVGREREKGKKGGGLARCVASDGLRSWSADCARLLDAWPLAAGPLCTGAQ